MLRARATPRRRGPGHVVRLLARSPPLAAPATASRLPTRRLSPSRAVAVAPPPKDAPCLAFLHFGSRCHFACWFVPCTRPCASRLHGWRIWCPDAYARPAPRRSSRGLLTARQLPNATVSSTCAKSSALCVLGLTLRYLILRKLLIPSLKFQNSKFPIYHQF